MTLLIRLTERFLKGVARLPPDRQKGVAGALKKFQDTRTLKSLDFRALKGAPSHFIINARHGDRIILKQIDEERWEAVDVGPHDNVYRRWDR